MEDIKAYNDFINRLQQQKRRGNEHWKIASDPKFDLMFTIKKQNSPKEEENND